MIPPDIDFCVIVNDAGLEQLSGNLADQLHCPLYRNFHVHQLQQGAFALVCDGDGLSLQQGGRDAPGPVRVDFISGALAHRGRSSSSSELIAKAVGIKSGLRPNILDLTAGMGQDAFVLASLGCSLTLVERSPLVFHLLQDGRIRALVYARESDAQLWSTIERISIQQYDGIDYLKNLPSDEQPDVVYLDPMFPERSKSAKVKKNMQAFHKLIGSDDDADELLGLALEKAKYRVVVKRPSHAPPLGNNKPSLEFGGKSVRFDVYPLRKMITEQ